MQHSVQSTPCARWGNSKRIPAALLAAFYVAFGFAALGQEADEASEEEETAPRVVQATGPVEQVIVTGSRLRRDTYSSVAPLQIINAEVKREAGLIDPGAIIQESTASQGVQFDLTFQGYVLDDGPGSTTANLRGLGASRTLVLINGRRVAPSGVEGVPSNPDLSILPGMLIRQYDQLLDGASSVYGSDAVAGVVNALLRKDFNGFEMQMQADLPAHGAGDQENIGIAWGRNFDRGFLGFGAQFIDAEPITLDDRPWTAGCERHVEIDQAGRIRHQDLYYSDTFGMDWDDCTIGSLAGRVSVGAPRFSIYYTPGYSNGGWPDFSESNVGAIPVDGDGDGRTDMSYRDYSLNGREQFAHLRASRKTTSAMVYGEYTLEGEWNLTPYFEVLRATRDTFANSGAGQLFPYVPPDNPYSICNPAGQGVDCGLANDALLTNPNFTAAFADFYAGACARFGVPPAACIPSTFGWLLGPTGPVETRPIVSVLGDRNNVETEATWWRYVGGVQGDLPFMNVGSLSNWTFNASVTRSTSQAAASRLGVRQDRLELALGYYSQNTTPCEANISEEVRTSRRNSRGTSGLHELRPDTGPGCVPVNMFAPSLYRDVIGDFNTKAERDYVFDSRDFDTEYDQTVFSLFTSGTLFQLPDGEVVAGAGIDYRIDEIRSIPDAVAREGLFWGFFADGGAVGDKYTREAFGEVELPLVGGRPGVTELTLNLSTRWTDDEFYGGAWTGASKLGWRPIDSLLFRTTWGTSYRAPNLRELFLQGQTGFRTVLDPCLVPEGAIDPLTSEYNQELDWREPHILDNCRASGVDPLVAQLGFASYSVEFVQGGSLTLDEETSESKSFGFSWDQPFTNVFNLNVGMSYYDIEIEDTIIEPSAGYILFDCYYSQTSAHTFCDRITRDGNPARPLITAVDAGFINRDSERVRGVDLNIAYDQTVTIFNRPIDISFEATGHRLIARTTLQLNDQGDRDEEQYHREGFYPEHEAELSLRVDYDKLRFAWSTRYLGNHQEDQEAVEPWSEATTASDTCLGPPNDLLCRDLGWTSDYWVHHSSITYSGNTWNVRAGVRNVFDIAPPQVDGTDTVLWSTVNNTPTGAGYDLWGRTWFLSTRFNIGEQ